MQNYHVIIIVELPIFTKYCTIFAFCMEKAFIYDNVRLTPSQQIPIHTQNEWELSYVIHGKGTRILGDERQAFREGEVLLIPPYFPHGWFFDKDSADDNGLIHNITLLFASDLPARLSSVFPELTTVVNNLSAISVPRRYVGKTCDEIIKSLVEMQTLDSAKRLPLILHLLIFLSENAESEDIGDRLMNKSIRNAERFRIYCECNFYRNIGLEETAAYMKMNKSALCKFVKKHTGQTFTGYINSLRLEKAALLLTSTTDPACDIAYDCGFASIPYFHRLFSRRYGISPCKYRKNYYFNHQPLS